VLSLPRFVPQGKTLSEGERRRLCWMLGVSFPLASHTYVALEIGNKATCAPGLDIERWWVQWMFEISARTKSACQVASTELQRKFPLPSRGAKLKAR
jgi:hypothetical protein